MMGYGEDKGIIPRTCSELFNRINQNSDPSTTFCAEVSYIEIYNEKVRDLLNPRNKGNLKVREHPSHGPYVEDLSRLVVKSFGDIEHLMDEGNKARTVAATNMNETSSRSHAVFTIILTQKTMDVKTKQQSEKVSRFSLVDLAGSERANSTGASGMRLKEGANINRSLTTLGKVIAGLAEQTTPHSTTTAKSNKKKDSFVPYRDSVLTWLLKDSLGGNSKTAMIAAISPADFDETLSTLRYADQAKKIKTKAVVNEDPSVRLIRDLKSEIQTLKQSLLAYVPHPEQLQHGEQADEGGAMDDGNYDSIGDKLQGASTTIPVLPSKSILITDAFGNATELTKREVVEQLKSSQKLLGDIDQSWEDRLQTTVQIQHERERALVELGITVAKNEMGVYTPRNTPHLVNLNEDPLMSECLVYQIKPGTTLVGRKMDNTNVNGDQVRDGSDGDKQQPQQYIRLSGSNILESHCRFENVDEVVTIYPNEHSVTMVNGIHINEPEQLKSGYRIILGDYHVFRFNHPEEARRERDEWQRQQELTTISTMDDNTDAISNENGSISIATASMIDEADWLFARREAVMHYFQQQQQQQQQQYNTSSDDSLPTPPTGFETLTNEELEKLFDDVTKMRKIRKRQSSHSGSGLSQPMSPCSSTSSFSFRHSATPSTVSTMLYENGGFYGSSYSADDTDSMVDREIIRLAREELRQQLDEQKTKYEKRIQRLSSLYPLATIPTKTETLTSSSQHSSFSLLSPSFGYSDDERIILAKVVHHWRAQHYVHLAETLLMNGTTISEVNSLARQLDKNVIYQLTIIHNANSTYSAWEDDITTSRLDKTLLTLKTPSVGVLVIDTKHRCSYLWSLDRLKTRLRHMQGIRFVTDQTHHLVTGSLPPKPSDKKTTTKNAHSKNNITADNDDDDDELDLFYDSHPPQYDLIGMARMRLRHLALHVPMEQTLDVFCQQTCRLVGQLSVLIAPIARSKERQVSPSIYGIVDGSSSPIPTCSTSQRTVTGDTIKQQNDALQVGQRLVFEVRIGCLTGVDKGAFTQVHTQFRLNTFGDDNDDDDGDQIYTTSQTSEFDEQSTIDFGYSKTFSMVVTEEMLAVIQNDDLTFEIFGQPQPGRLKTFQEEPCADQQLPLIEKKHNVYAWVEICELAQESGEYAPVQVEKRAATRIGSAVNDDNTNKTKPPAPFSPSSSSSSSLPSLPSSVLRHHPPGTFMLRQGHQRRILLMLRHDWILPLTTSGSNSKDTDTATDGDEVSEDGLTLDGMDGLLLWIGNIRQRSSNIDDDTTTNAQDISIPLTVVTRTKDTLVLQGSWDSSMHNSLLLNRLTDAGQTVDLTIKWIFHGAPFQMDVGVQIITGSNTTINNGNGLVKRKSLLRNFFTSSSSSTNVRTQQRNKDNNGCDTDADDDNDDDDDSYRSTSRRSNKNKTSVAGIYRVWERPRRLASYYVHQQINSEYHTWQQHQMEKIKTYDLARRSMLTKLEVAHTRYTLALWDLLQNRHVSLGRFAMSPANSNKKLDDSDDEPIPQPHRRHDHDDRLRAIIQQWMDSKREESTGLHLINAFGSLDTSLSPTTSTIKNDIPLYDIHQITLSDEGQLGRNESLMFQQSGYMKIRKLSNDEGDHPKQGSRWTKRWFLLKRPYLLIYADDRETNELDFLIIKAVRVNPPVKDLVNTFTLYTTINTYQCQTTNHDEMNEWVASMI
ncbi:unnamed protein product [Absidia cylindrospora]